MGFYARVRFGHASLCIGGLLVFVDKARKMEVFFKAKARFSNVFKCFMCKMTEFPSAKYRDFAMVMGNFLRVKNWDSATKPPGFVTHLVDFLREKNGISCKCKICFFALLGYILELLSFHAKPRFHYFA